MLANRVDVSDLVERASAQCACFNLRKAARAVTQHYDELLRPLGLRGTQFTLLVAIQRRGPVTVNELASAVVMDRTTLTRNLRPLDREGWIRIAKGTDRRVREVSLTPKGVRLLERALPLWQRAQKDVLVALGERRLHQLLDQLVLTVDAFK